MERRPTRSGRAGALVVSVVVAALVIGGLTWARLRTPAARDPSPVAAPKSVRLAPASNGLIAYGDGTSLFTVDPETGKRIRLDGIPPGSLVAGMVS